jgi:hypothetical protein
VSSPVDESYLQFQESVVLSLVSTLGPVTTARKTHLLIELVQQPIQNPFFVLSYAPLPVSPSPKTQQLSRYFFCSRK